MIIAKVNVKEYEKMCAEWENPWGLNVPRKPTVWKWDHRNGIMLENYVVLPNERICRRPA